MNHKGPDLLTGTTPLEGETDREKPQRSHRDPLWVHVHPVVHEIPEELAHQVQVLKIFPALEVVQLSCLLE